MNGNVRYLKQMNTNLSSDRALEYRTKVSKIEHMISEIKDAGFETLKYEDFLRRIKKDTDQNNFQSVDENVLKNGIIEIDYVKAIEQLKMLENMLIKYDVYIKSISSCRYVIETINENNNLQQIKYYANLIIMVLRNIKMVGISNLQEEEKIINEIYEIAYRVIKLELLITGKSDIYEYAMDNDSDIYSFDKLVKDDIKDIDLSDDKVKYLKSKLYEIKSRGIETSYFDIELIKLLSKYENKDYQDRVIKRMNKIIDEIQKQGDKLNQKMKEVEKLKSDIVKIKRENRPYIGNATLRVLSLIVGASLFVGGGYGLFRLAKNMSTYLVYKKDTKIYSELTDMEDTYSEEALLSFSKDATDEVLVRVYSPWEVDGDGEKIYRTVETYDLSEITLDSIYDYLSYDIYKGDLIDEEKVKYEGIDDLKYSQEYMEVEQSEYTDLDKQVLKEGELALGTVMLWLLYILLTIAMYLVFTDDDLNSLCFDDIFDDLSRDFDWIKDSVIEKRDNIKKLKIKLKEMLDIVYADDEKRLEFTKLFEENKYLLNDPEELMKRFNELKDKQINDKVRTLSKKYGVK